MTTFKRNLHTLEGQADDRALITAKKRFAAATSPPPPGLENRQPNLTRRWAQVSVTHADGTVDLSIDGSTIAGVQTLASYFPVVGDAVMVDFMGGDLVVIGAANTGRASSGLPPGTILDFASGTPPPGFLLCDGTSYATATYPALFAVIGYTYGGSGANFNTPDARGRALIGSGTGPGLTARTVGDTGGEENHVLSTAEMPVHGHGLTQTGLVNQTDPASTQGLMVSPSGNKVQGDALTVNNAGSGGAHNTMQPFLVVTKIIKI